MTTSPAKTTTKRHDIQGLRALAVLLVVAEHAFGQPVGGFIGVDVFFVLSGFLMTSILFREFENTGRIRFLAFYRRRVRRLIPAAAATIGATVVASYFLFASGRFTSTLWDALTALGFVSNWRYAAVETDYFARGAATSPLQHFWSLSVEEQYYLIWPLALLVLCVIAYATTMRRTIVALLALTITLGLFVLAFTYTNSDPGTAYFITPARMWELSLGGVIALAMPLFNRVGRGPRPFLMVIGFAGILVAAFITPNGAGFPAPWSALSVLSTALILAFPWQPTRHAAWNPLTNPVAGYVGDISYSLYLWHFPAIILLAEAFRGLPGDGTLIPAAVAVVASFGLAALSHRYIEEPVRKSQWLEPGRRRSDASRRRAKVFAVAALSIATCLSVILALNFSRQAPAVAQGTSPAAATATDSTTATPSPQASSESGAAEAALQQKLAAALKATSWPELSQDPGDPKDEPGDPLFDLCSSFNYQQEKCTWGSASAPKTAVLVGDSIAAAYLPGISRIFGQGDWKITAASLYACPFIDMDLGSNEKGTKYCADRKQVQVDLVNSVKPDLVIVANTYLRNTATATGKTPPRADWNSAFDRQLTKMDGSYKKLIVLPPPPYGAEFPDCYSPRTPPSACVTNISQSDYSSSMSGLSTVAKKHQGELLDNRKWFCVANKCPSFEGTTLVKKDSWHPINTFVLDILPVMQEAMLAAAEPAAAAPAADPGATDTTTDPAGTTTGK